MTQEALKLALEALYPISHNSTDDYRGQADKAITSLRKAIAEQVPFCYHDGRNIVGHEFADHSDVFPLYTSPPPQRKPLTDEEIEDLYFDKFSMSELKAFARAIEAAHGIKENT